MESKDLSLAIGKTCHELPRVAAVPKGLFMQFYFICSFDRFEVGYDHRAASQIREWLNAAKSLRFNWVLCIQETPGEGPSGLGLLTQKTPTSYLYIYIQFHETPSRKSQHDRTPSISSITRFLPGLMHGSWFSHLHRPSASSHKFEGPSGSPVACWECFPMVRSSIRAPPPKGMGSCGAKPPLLMSKL